MDLLRNVCGVTLCLIGVAGEEAERAAAELDKLHRLGRDVPRQVNETRLQHLSRMP